MQKQSALITSTSWHALRPVRDAHIKAEFNGFNHVELAEKYDVTERWVRKLCGVGFIEGQIGLFDEDDVNQELF